MSSIKIVNIYFFTSIQCVIIFFFGTQAALLMLVMAIALVDAYPRLVVLDDGQIEGIYYLDSARS